MSNLTIYSFYIKKSFLPEWEQFSKIAEFIEKDNYLEKFRADNKDLSRFLPFVTINKFSFSGNEFLYGWTYRTSAVINIRDDLQGEKRTEVEIHEAIHTSDEYETRRITEWIMQSLPKMEDKYLTKPPRYQI